MFDIRSKTEYDPVTKQRFACIDDAQQAALAIDSFYSCGDVAGNAHPSETGKAIHTGYRKRHNHLDTTPGFDREEMNSQPAKRPFL